MQKTLVGKSKFLSLVLRHDPGTINLTLDSEGRADVSLLLAKGNEHGTVLTRSELEEIVSTNEKKRFDLDPVQNRIRANQGHSIEVDLGLIALAPPEELFHGTAAKNCKSILNQGLLRGSRQHVHLSANVITAQNVGSRHGSPIVFRVASAEMHRQRYQFFQSKNGVWLTDNVPKQFLRRISNARGEFSSDPRTS